MQIADFEKFEDLLEAPWQVREIFDDLEDAYDYWKSLFDSIANEHAPTRKKQAHDKEVYFMTKEWEAAIRIKSRKVCYSICKSPHTRKLWT